MKKNMGSVDKITRILVAVAFVVLFLTHVVTGVWGYVMLAVAAIFVVTSLIGFCPLYLPFRINTGKKEK